MDGVGGLNQPHIKPGETYVYEWQIAKSGTFMYHPHADEMVQMAMGMMGFFVVHPKDPKFMRVDRDFVFLLNAYDIDPGSYVPRIAQMLNLICGAGIAASSLASIRSSCARAIACASASEISR